MPANGLVRAAWDNEGPHSHTNAGVPGNFRAWDGKAAHVVGSGSTPHHNGHAPGGIPCGGHGVGLQHIHSQVANAGKKKCFVNGMPPVLEGDNGCWSDPCHGSIETFVVHGRDKKKKLFIQGKRVAVQNDTLIQSGSMHGGGGNITNGGSGDTYVGIRGSKKAHG